MQQIDLDEAVIEGLQTFIPIFYLGLAAYLTTHILRYKSDPRGSLLWITLIWFAPLIGAFLYLVFGINRISRRAQRLGLSERARDPECENCELAHGENEYWRAFCRLGCKILKTPQIGGNSIEVLQGVDHIHNEMIDAINAATSQILLTTFIFKYDDLGKRVIAALDAAKARGVETYSSLDGFGNSVMGSGAYWALRRNGHNVHRFLHSYWPWRMPYFNLRNHRKLLIVDQRLGFTGSLNIGRVINRETHFKIKGPIIEQMIDAFKEDWSMSTKRPFPDTKKLKPGDSEGQILMRGIKSGPAYALARTKTILSGALGAATDNVRIISPYFVPDKGMISDLELTALRGVNVEIFLPAKTNHRITDWAARRQLRPLLGAGCKVYFRDGPFDHSKFMTVDNRWVLLGSSNWDSRSLRLNFEFDMECINAEFAEKMNAVIHETRLASEHYDKATHAKRHPVIVLRDSAARLLLPYL